MELILYIIIAALLIIIFGITIHSEHKRIQLTNKLKLVKLENEKLTEMEHIRSRVFTNLSHEFRTLLMLIMGPLDLLQKNINEEILRQNIPLQAFEQFQRVISQENARKYLYIMRNNAQLLHRLVNQLLQMADIDTGRLALKTRPVEIISHLKDSVFSFTPQAHNKNITISFSSKQESLFLYLDYDKFEIIMNNLILNAIKFTPPGGSIDLNANRISNCLTINNNNVDCLNIEVSDTGIGIEPNQLEHIFDRFYQVNQEKSAPPEGLGIGLAFCRELVELHYGQIKVESLPGKGSIFTLSLPIGKAHLKEEEIEAEYIKMTEPQPESILSEQSKSISIKTRQDKPHILIVEDNEEMRFYMRSILEKNYHISEANGGRHAWEMALKFVPDLIVSDIMMSDMDGISLCIKVKNDKRLNHIPVILLTARASKDDKILGFDSGADDYVTKPFHAEEVLARIKNMLNQRKKLQEHIRHNLLIEPSAINETSDDERFIDKARKIMEEHLSDTEFSVDKFASEMAFCRFHLNRKFQAIVGLSSSRFMRDVRLRKAAQLIIAQKGNISQIALEVGFENFAYFARCFKNKFGCTPSQYHEKPSV